MKIQCAWCKKMLGEKEPYESELISHTICSECSKKYFPQITSLRSEEKESYSMKSRMEVHEKHKSTLSSEDLKKIRINSLGKIDSTEIFKVDGEYIRDNVDVDFVLGGNPGVYDYIPEKEIWIDEASSPKDIAPDILHEYIEYLNMLDGKNYDEAHEIASTYERKLRQVKDIKRIKSPLAEVKEFINKENNKSYAMNLFHLASILDYPKPGLDPGIWESDGKMVKEVKEQIIRKIRNFFLSKNIQNYKRVVKKILIIGSLTSYQYNSKSDFDCHLRVRLHSFQKALKAQGMDLTDEKAVELLDEDWREQLNTEYGEKAYGTEHPIEFYFEVEGYTGAQQTDGVYDLLADEWIKEPRTIDWDFNVEETYSKTIESVEDLMQEFDVNIGGIKRTVQDIEFLQETVKKFEKSKRKLFYKRLKEKITEVDDSILHIIEEGQKIIDERKEDYKPESDANIRFKYIQRYGYIWLIKQLEKILKDETTEEPEVQNLQDVKKVKEVLEDFEESKQEGILAFKDSTIPSFTDVLQQIRKKIGSDKVAEEEFEASTIQTSDVPDSVIDQIKEIQKNIDSKKLNSSQDHEGWIKGGLQMLFHITVLYGVKESTRPLVQEIFDKYKDIKVKTEKVDYFDVEDMNFTVAVVKCSSTDLRKLHEDLRDQIENQHGTFVEGYTPHITIAYLNLGDRIDGESTSEEWSINSLEMSTKEGDVVRIEHKKKSYSMGLLASSESKLLIPYRDEEGFADFKKPNGFDDPSRGHRPMLRDDAPHTDLKEKWDEEHEMFFGPSFPQNLRHYNKEGEAAPGPWYLYILHFDEPYEHALHYVGITNDVERRYQEHLTGKGGRLPAVVREKGISFTIDVLEEFPTYEEAHAREKHLKQVYKKSKRFCPRCKDLLKGEPKEVTEQLIEPVAYKMADKVLFEHPWKTVMETDDGYVYMDDPEGVGVLPYRITDEGKYEFLIRNEKNPLFGELITIVTGRRDKEETEEDWAISTGIRELKEEAGIDVGEDDSRINVLGTMILGKDNKNPDVLLAVDATGLPQTTPETDGSDYEKESKNFWVNEDQLKEYIIKSPDSFLGTITNKFFIQKEKELNDFKDHLINEYGYLSGE